VGVGVDGLQALINFPFRKVRGISNFLGEWVQNLWDNCFSSLEQLWLPFHHLGLEYLTAFVLDFSITAIDRMLLDSRKKDRMFPEAPRFSVFL
jgi:hypothetical protein